MVLKIRVKSGPRISFLTKFLVFAQLHFVIIE